MDALPGKGEKKEEKAEAAAKKKSIEVLLI